MRKLMLSGVLILAACAGPDPIIGDLEEDKVVILAYGLDREPEVRQAADQACAIHNRGAVGPINVSLPPHSSRWSYLYACK